MTSTSLITPRRAGVAAMVASAALAVGGIIQLTDESSGESTVVGIEHVTLGAFSVMLALFAVVTLHLGRIAGRPRVAAVVAAAQVALGSVAVVSNVRGEDPSFFPAVAVPANLVWLAGWVVLAVALRRGGHVPRAVAVGVPLTWVFALPLSAVGGGLVAGAFWLAFGWLLVQGEVARSAPARA